MRCESPADPAQVRNLARLRRAYEAHGFDRTDEERSRIRDVDVQLDRATRQAPNQDAESDEERVRTILRLRRERAALVGRSSFAALVLPDRTLSDPTQVRAFLADLGRRISPALQQESQEADGPPDQLGDYFARGRVIAGLLALAERLFGLEFERADPVDEVYRVELGKGRSAYVQFDLVSRDNKAAGRWMQELPDAPDRRAVVVDNLPGDDPALTHAEVRGLFHEFGHALHHLLGRTDVPGLAGTRVPWDFVEFPALLLEHWAWEREVLDLFARHPGTGAPLPASRYRELRASRRRGSARTRIRQLDLAELDLALHLDYDPDGDESPDAFSRRVLASYRPADDSTIANFKHVFGHPTGYACGYYAYLWADVLAADVFSRFEAHGVLNRSLGDTLRAEMLDVGNHRAPADSFGAFMGRPPRIAPYLRREGLT